MDVPCWFEQCCDARVTSDLELMDRTASPVWYREKEVALCSETPRDPSARLEQYDSFHWQILAVARCMLDAVTSQVK